MTVQSRGLEFQRASSRRPVIVYCADCQAAIERPYHLANVKNYCPACKRSRQLAQRRAWERANSERRSAEKRAKRAAAGRAAGFVAREHQHTDDMTMTRIPDDSWPVPATLGAAEWRRLIAAGDLAGAEFVDARGRRWIARERQLQEDR